MTQLYLPFKKSQGQRLQSLTCLYGTSTGALDMQVSRKQ